MNLKITGLKIDDALKGYSAPGTKGEDQEGGKEPEKGKKKKVLKSASNPSTGTQMGHGGPGE